MLDTSVEIVVTRDNDENDLGFGNKDVMCFIFGFCYHCCCCFIGVLVIFLWGFGEDEKWVLFFLSRFV